jgi:hypothetical protein
MPPNCPVWHILPNVQLYSDICILHGFYCSFNIIQSNILREICHLGMRRTNSVENNQWVCTLNSGMMFLTRIHIVSLGTIYF